MLLVKKYAKQIEKYAMVDILDPLWITAPGPELSLIAKHSRIILWVVLQTLTKFELTYLAWQKPKAVMGNENQSFFCLKVI